MCVYNIYINWSPFGCIHDYLDASSSRLGIPAYAIFVASLFRNGF